MRKVCYIIAFAVAAICCSPVSDDTSIYELGPVSSELSVSYEGGECGTDILSNGEFSITIPEEAAWF